MEKKLTPFNADIYLEEKFLEIKKNNNLDTVIETGTFHGATTIWFSQNFKKVYTVECNEVYFKESGENIGNPINVIRKLQDSPVFLKEVLPLIDDSKTIIFLDAHWYTNPVLNELIAIKESGKKPILAIHDFMVPDHPEFGYDIYPEQDIVYNWEWIQNYIEDIYGKNGYTRGYNTEATGAMRGCLFIFPTK
jgi:cephalosporin hydroxylase